MDFAWRHELYGSNLELLGVVTGILSVLLLLFTRQQKLQWLNWPNGVVTSVVYAYLFYHWGLYGNMAIQPVFVLISAQGAWYWRGQLHAKFAVVPEVKTTWSSWQVVFLMICVAGVLTGLSQPILRHYHDPQPLFDALLFGIQASGIVLQYLKKVQSWFFWIATDIIAVPFHFHNGHHATAGLYFVYGVMSIVGLWTWWTDVASPAGDSGLGQVNLVPPVGGTIK